MAENDGHRGQGASGAIRPGTLTALLQEIAAAPQEKQGGAWEASLRPGIVVGRFELVRELGRGGFGVVWEARDRELGRAVAFKAVRAGGRTAVREERLLREAEAAARLSHPNIVTLFDVGRADQGPYLVLELLRGRTLMERLSQGPLPPPEALRIAVDVAKGLAHAHGEGVVHRDLKPENVFLCEGGQVKVLDFGLAHAFGRRRAAGGTSGYMAPEQAEGAPEDERTDVFALGVILFEMLSGKLPFEDAKALRSAGFAPVLKVPGQPALGELISRMLSKRAVARPRDGGEVLAAFLALERQPPRTPLAVAGAVRIQRPKARKKPRALRPAKAERSALPSIAVLPFADMSPGRDQEYFADGVAEEIVNALTHVQGMRVVGRTSSFSFKGRKEDLRSIGRKLGASTVLEGSVRTDGGRVRITAQLVKAADGYHLWSETYDRDLTRIFDVQDELARAVVSALRVRLLPGEGLGATEGQTSNPEARNQYLLGVQFARQGSMNGYRRAEEALQRALALDPDFARAHVLLAWSLSGRCNAGDSASAAETAEFHRRALAAAERAVELAPGLAEAYQVRGFMRRRFLFDWPGAQADLRHALALSPRDPDALWSMGLHTATLGRLADGLADLRKATDLDPLSAQAWRWLGFVYLAAGEPARAREAVLRAVEIAPEDDWALVCLAMSYLAAGEAREALEAMESSRTEGWRLWGRALAQHSLGNPGESQRALDELTPIWAHIGGYQIAQCHAWRGNLDRAFEWLERCHQDYDSGLALMGLDQLLRDLRADPRWKALLRKMNLPD